MVFFLKFQNVHVSCSGVWVWQKGICFFSWHPWYMGQGYCHHIAAIKYQRSVMTDSGGSQSPVRMYLESIVRRNVFHCKAGMSAVIHPEGTGGKTTCRVCCEPNNLLCSRLSSLESAAEQEVDGSSRSHLSSTQSSRYKLVLFNEGLVASMKLLQSVSLQGGSCRHQITIRASTNHGIHFTNRSELEWTKRDDLPFQPCCSAVGFACWLCEVKWSLDFGLLTF